MGEFPSGQRGQTVNLLSVTSVVRIHLPPPRKTVAPSGVTVFLFVRWIRRGAEVNDAPAAHQSRGTACPQAGESTFPHQERAGENQLVLFYPTTQKYRAGACAPTRYRLSLYFFVRPSPLRGGAFSFFSRRSRPPRRNRRPSPRTSGRRRKRGSFPRRAAKHKVFVSKIKLSQVSCYVKNIFARILLNLIDRYKLLR